MPKARQTSVTGACRLLWQRKFEFDTAVFWRDARKSYPQVRYSALGFMDGRVHSLVFTETEGGIRIISFRKANKREVKRYEQETQSRAD